MLTVTPYRFAEEERACCALFVLWQVCSSILFKKDCFHSKDQANKERETEENSRSRTWHEGVGGRCDDGSHDVLTDRERAMHPYLGDFRRELATLWKTSRSFRQPVEAGQ